MRTQHSLPVVLLMNALLSGCNHHPAVPSGPIELETRHVNEKGQYVYAGKSLDPTKTAIIVVDMWQEGTHGYIKPDGGFEGTNEGYFYQERVADSINETLSAARSLGFIIVHAPAGQTYLYQGHPARENITKLAHARYPWSSKPEWNKEQGKIPFASFPYEYEYAYPYTSRKKNRPGTVSYGQNPRIVIADNDYITADVEELWDLIEQRKIETLIYMGGSTNMCLAGRPYGLLNMKKYGKYVLLDRNYAHLVHRIPHGWNGDMEHPEYGPFYTNERNSQQVIHYFEKEICPTIDGMKIREIARAKGGYQVMKQPVKEDMPDANNLYISFQPPLIEIEKGYLTDVGWEYTKQPNGLTYGWNRLKVKDAIREGYRPVQSSFIKAVAGDNWKLSQAPANFTATAELSGAGTILANNELHSIHSSEHTSIVFTGSGSISLGIKSGAINLYQIAIKVK